MNLVYTSPSNDNIRVTLNNYEILSDFVGPVVFDVPVAEGNREYDYIVSRKLKINDYVAPVVVPQSVTPLQARKVLRALGYIDQIEALMSTYPPEVRDEWEWATVIERTNPLIAVFASQLGMTETDVDNLFIQASTL